MAKKNAEEVPGLVDQLRDLVRASGQTLTQLASITGVDPARLSRFLHAKRGLSQDALDRIVRALGIRLVREPGEGPPPPSEPPPEPAAPPLDSAEKPAPAGRGATQKGKAARPPKRLRRNGEGA